MITEIATIIISAGNEEAFAKAMNDVGLAHLRACPGVGKVQFGRGVENPSNFAFVVEWDSLEAHAAAKDTDDFRAFRAAMGALAVGGSMEHFALA